MILILAQTLWTLLCLAAIAVSVLVFVDGATRRAFLLSFFERFARNFPPTFAIVGDSLAAQCRWRALGRRPFDVIDLAVGGATIKEIAGQIRQADAIGAKCLIIDGGLNDLLFDGASVDQIEHDFRALLRRIPPDRKAIVTLMPYVSDPASAPHIDAGNGVIRALAESRGFEVVDLNPQLSEGGVRRPEMTDDGLHFTPRACAIWVEAVRARLSARERAGVA